MTDQPTFSIVIPTYNRSAIVEQTLRQLIDQDYPQDRYEILVVDNSTDETPAMVERVAATAPVRVRLLARPDRLPAVKRNIGVAEATGDLMVFLNDDLWVGRTFLSEHAATHAREAEPVAVLGRCEQSDKMLFTPFTEWYQPFAYAELDAGAELRWWHFWTMNISLPRQVMLERNLLFHEDWAEIGSEDVELGWRWTKAGYAIRYNPNVWGEHYHPHDLATACRLQEQVGRGLRDLEVLIDDPRLLSRYGIFSWANPPKAIVRGLVRRALFNARTVPAARRWLESRPRNTAVTRWMYWKVLLHHTNLGYRDAPGALAPTTTDPRGHIVSERPLVSAVIVNWNTVDLLERCLTALDNHPCTRGSTEYVVVDNGSGDGSADLVRSRWPQAILIANEDNRGYTQANNQGIKASSGELVLLVNTDAFVGEGAIDRMVDRLLAEPRAAIVGPRLSYGDGSWQRWTAGRQPRVAAAVNHFFFLEHLGARFGGIYLGRDRRDAFQPDWVSSACLLVRRATLDEIGLLDESFFLYMDDVDLCARARRAGWTVWYEPAAEVVHLMGASTERTSGASSPKALEGLFRYIEREDGRAAGATVRAIAAAGFALRAAIYALRAIAPGDRARLLGSSRSHLTNFRRSLRTP